MAFANSSISDIIATNIQSRSGELADNVTNNNALLRRLKDRGNVKTFSGGNVILQELSFQENSNAGWYSGYDVLPVGVSDVAAESAGRPENINCPPSTPAPGPRSIRWSAAFIISPSCSTTTTVAPASRMSHRICSSRCVSRGCSPEVGSSRTKQAP